MEDPRSSDSPQNPEALDSSSSLSCAGAENPDFPVQEREESAMAFADVSLVDSMLCDSASRLIPSGLTRSNSTDEFVMFVNAGGEAMSFEDSSLKFVKDTCYEGGNVLRTNENIIEAGDFPFVYQSARFGNFRYRFNEISPGEYYIDLHFSEIINTNGPIGMRVFNVYIQEEKVLSDFDVFSVVGANKPLQVVDLRVAVKENEAIVVRFEGIIGSPSISGIGIRKALNVSEESLRCENCLAEFLVPSIQMKLMQTKSTAKFEKKIQELTTQCQLKANECHEAWLSLTSANKQLDNVRMELDNVTFKALSQEQAAEKQANDLENISNRYENDKKNWAMAVIDLQDKIKFMKSEHSQLSRVAHDCADTIPIMNKMVFAIQGLVAQCEDLKLRYSEEQAKRKKLFNEVQDAKGNIRVFCRCRPLNKAELDSGSATIVDFDAAKDGSLGILTNGSTKKSFKFDRVYSPKDGQVDVFADASPMVTSVLDGYNVCIFAYGQTGTGKTFTMEGNGHNRGVNYRTLEQLFEIASERAEFFAYDIMVSVLEVYNEQIRDLLAPTSKKLEIKQDLEGSHHVPGLVEAKVSNIDEAWNVLQAGSNARATGSNNVNEHSSRSHCLLSITVKAKNLMSEECTRSKLWLVDLAGSERLGKTEAQGERMKEAQSINKSLSALGDVISALANKSSHIPYRNSKLTHLLQDSLGGDSKTLMFVQISPSEHDSGETLSSLNFATRVRGIDLGPARKQVDTSELQKTKAMLDRARQEARSKDESVKKLEANLQSLENKVKGKDQIYKSQQDKIKELESQLVVRTNSHSQSEKQVSQLSDKLQEREEICCSLQQKVKELEVKLRERQQSESEAFQQTVKDLETKLAVQVQEAKSEAAILHQKIRELEIKLKEEQEQNQNSLLLHQKIKELEEIIREKEEKIIPCIVAHETPAEKSKPSAKDEPMIDIEAYVLRSSNSVNRPMSQGSIRGFNLDPTIQGTRRKRDFNTENIMMVSSGKDGNNKVRKSDPPKIARVVRSTKPIAAPASGQASSSLVSHKRVVRDPVQGVKERESKKKLWSR